MKYVLAAPELSASSPIGGKARALLSLRRAQLPIPEWLVVLPAAYAEWSDPARRAAVEEQILAEIRAGFPSEPLFAVRSSALDEDGAENSFAGQLESYLFVKPTELLARVQDVWKSGFSERIAAYRRERSLPPASLAPAVIIQRMIDAESAGVAFGADPVSGRRSVTVVSSVWGLGTALVGGDIDADVFHVDRQKNILSRHIAQKTTAHRLSGQTPEGTEAQPVAADLVQKPSLTDEGILAVADLVRLASQHFGRPQDIEWALQEQKIYLLQSRPITSLNSLPDPDGVLNLWDNSNIAESYNGVTTPLTFSFARGVYEEVYRQFCRMMGVSETKIANHRTTFRRMLGLVRGRIYYNLVSWYRVLALLPGFQINRTFMEQMMGVKEPLPEKILAEFATATSLRARVADGVDLIRTLLGLVQNHFNLQGKIDAFYLRLNEALKPPATPLTEQRTDELAAHYQHLEGQLLARWDAPLINDFLAMIFYGVLRKLCAKYCGSTDGTLQNDLISAEGGIISAEPAKRLRTLSGLAAKEPALVQLLTDGSIGQIQDAVPKNQAFAAEYQAYLEKFGDRCLEELKLETETLHDAPLTLLRSIGQMARRVGQEAPKEDFSGQMRAAAEARVAAALRWQPGRQLLFGWVLRNARARVRERENLRFERTRLFGRVRRIFVEIGKRFQAVDVIAEPRDIFYLTVEEILGFIDGTAVSADLKGLIGPRKLEFQRYRDGEPPADRFETVGMVHQGNKFQSSRPAAEAHTGEQLQGIGCCPGRVKGQVRVVLKPQNAEVRQGEILVAPRTDPGWIMLFPSASGLLVEHGSLLSHSAIVSRELGLPAIVSLPGLTTWLKTGDWVEFDGSTGLVKKIKPD